MSAGLGRELDYVVAASLDQPMLPGGAGGPDHQFDWHELWRLATAHRVEGLVRRRLLEEERIAPPDTTEAFEQVHQAQVFGYLASAAETMRLVELLGVNGHASIVLKGCAVAQAYYAPTPALKYSSDIDILVAPRSFEAADRLIREAGYDRVAPNGEMRSRSESMARHLVNAYEYCERRAGHRVELHHRLLADPFALAIPFDVVLARSVEIQIGAGSCRGLGVTDLLVYLCSHGAGHGYARLKWLADVARVLRTLSDSAVAGALEHARSYNAGRSMLLTLGVLRRLGMGGVPMVSKPGDRSCERLVDGVMRAIVKGMRHEPLGLGDLGAQIGAMRYQLALAECPASKRHVLIKQLVNLDDTRLLGLGVEWRLLYALLGRPLALARYGRRALAGQP